MALVLKDRVKETTTTTSTGPYTLAGAVTGYQSFSVVGDGNTTYYTVTNGTDWEVGIGTYTSSGTTLSRDTILESSNAGSAVNWGSGSKDVFLTYPAEKAVTADGVNPFTSPVLVGVNSASTALEIRQTGSGNALLVEDGSNPDATPTVIDQYGNLILGKSTRQGLVANAVEAHGRTSGISTEAPAFGFYNWNSISSVSSSLSFFHIPSGTIGTGAANSVNDTLGRIQFVTQDNAGSYGAGYITGAVSSTDALLVNLTYTANSHSFSGAITSGTWNGSAIGAAYGGTGQTTYATGDLLYASASTTLAKLGIGAQGQILQAGATTPEWGGLSGNVTTIQLRFSSTPGSVPTGASLSAGELVVNTADGKLYFKDSGGTVKVLSQADQIAPLTTKGDLLVNNGTSNVRLPVGTNNYVLTADSSTATGLAWAVGGGGISSANIQEFTSTGTSTWTKPSGAKFVYVLLYGGGGGGGSGRRRGTANVATAAACGGSAGGAGGRSELFIPASLLGATETVTVGAGGTGGAARTTDDTSGQAGNDGNNSSFGSWALARPGLSGAGGTTAAAVQGGNGGAVVSVFRTANSAYANGSGNGNTTTGSAGDRGGYGPGGGGGGGGNVSGNTAQTSGGAGGLGGAIFATATTATGGGGAAGSSGGAGTAGAVASSYYVGGSGGGGGSSNSAGAAGAGGTGGYPGGGGGGGGAGGSSTNSGAGGNGGDGYCLVVTFF